MKSQGVNLEGRYVYVTDMSAEEIFFYGVMDEDRADIRLIYTMVMNEHGTILHQNTVVILGKIERKENSKRSWRDW